MVRVRRRRKEQEETLFSSWPPGTRDPCPGMPLSRSRRPVCRRLRASEGGGGAPLNPDPDHEPGLAPSLGSSGKKERSQREEFQNHSPGKFGAFGNEDLAPPPPPPPPPTAGDFCFASLLSP
ncbi:hypothetical protein K456DRAFT_905090 [Colletotrichum gloeosporioides 23]|nr:hypothetical protein K456DRAFT_905090 [Colletotrichum gloeosporioides 23]